MNSKTVIYVAGSPRSGTTLLDRALGAADPIWGGGELVLTFDYIMNEAAICACGSAFRDCPYWSRIIDAFSTDAVPASKLANWLKIRQQIEGRGGLKFLKHIEKYPQLAQPYTEFTNYFFDRLATVLGDGKKYIVDSSKSDSDAIWRPMAFRKLCGLDVRVIHIFRDVRGTITSYKSGSNTAMEQTASGDKGVGYFVSYLYWVWTNFCAAHLRSLLGRDRYIAISYERLCANPESTLAELEQFLGLARTSLSKNITEGTLTAGGHQVYGNRMRYMQEVKISTDKKWVRALPVRYKILGGITMFFAGIFILRRRIIR